MHAINVTAEVRKILGSTLLDKLDKLFVHGKEEGTPNLVCSHFGDSVCCYLRYMFAFSHADRAPPYSSDAYELSKPVLRKRTKPTIGHENTSKGFPAWPKPPRGHPLISM